MDTIDLTPSAKEEILKMASQGLQIPHVTHPQHPSQIFHLVNFFCSCTKQCFGSKQRGGQRLRCGRHSGRQTECAANHSHSNAAGAVVRLVDLANHFPFVLFCGFNTTPSTIRIDFSVAFVFIFTCLIFPPFLPAAPLSFHVLPRFQIMFHRRLCCCVGLCFHCSHCPRARSPNHCLIQYHKPLKHFLCFRTSPKTHA